VTFCPRCGLALEGQDRFCSRCGYDVGARLASPSPVEGRAELPVLLGLGLNSAYYLRRDGILSVQLVPYSKVVLASVAAASVPVLVELLLNPTSLLIWVAAWFAPLALLLDELKARALRRLRGTSPDELARRPGSSFTPWQSVKWVELRGDKLGMFEGGNYLLRRVGSVVLSRTSIPLARLVMAENLGQRFREKSGFGLRSKVWNVIPLAIILFALSELTFVAASTAPFFAGEQEAYASLLSTVKGHFANTTILQEFWLILVNNSQVATSSSVPGVGLLILILSNYNTGRILQIIALQANYPPSLVLVTLFLEPHTLLEELSYPLASAIGLSFVLRWSTKSEERMSPVYNRSSARLALSYLGVFLLLATAGALEVTEPLLGVAALLLWLPVIAGGIFLWRWYGRSRFRTRLEDHPKLDVAAPTA
jgi:hypothetical protein